MEATAQNTPRAMLGRNLKEKAEYRKTGNTNLIAGKHIVVTKVGIPCLYMGDDPRRNPPIQIMVSTFNGELAYLDIASKEAVEWVMEEKE